MQLKNFTLELSGKPFRDESDECMYAVCRKMFNQWKPLTDRADVVSVMLWISDGSEILEWTGDMSQKFEWAYWCGVANPRPLPEHITERQKKNTHLFPQKYIPEASPRPYSWLKRLIEVIRETGAEIINKPIRIGATFDNGPEFAISNFKYRKHREIAQGNSIYPNSFVTCNSFLHADPQPYAGFPDGIPEGLPFGHFFGKQFQAFARDFGYDYIWLSNGMGFGIETWDVSGALFDKHQFFPERIQAAKQALLVFWDEFVRAYPGVVIETRGSNFSAGVEIASDSCPLRELYRDYKIAPPVNSPWAALNFNSGLEIAAWLSHVAELPDERFPFRFYTHDPWFMNSPWLDRYGREPWDIYNPLSVSMIDGDGTIRTPNSIALLSIDDTWGRLPDQVPLEAIPHLVDAFENAPDAPAPLVWVYPFEEYSNSQHPDTVFNEDMFVGECIQSGLPLNTVISTNNFRTLLASGSRILDGSVLIVPLSATGDENWIALKTHLEHGGRILFYGSAKAASPQLRSLLGIVASEELVGDFCVKTVMPGDVQRNQKMSDRFSLIPQFNGGGLTETLTEEASSDALAWAEQNGENRIMAMLRKLPGNAQVGFVRSAMPVDPDVLIKRGFFMLHAPQAFQVPCLARQVLAELGWKILCSSIDASSLPPRTNIARHDNAFYFSVYAPDTTVRMSVNTPLGAPILSEMETELSNGDAIWHLGKSWHKECRLFVRQQANTAVSAKIQMQAFPGYNSRRHYSGLQNAEVRFFPPRGFEDKLEIMNSDTKIWDLLADCLVTPEWEDTPYGKCAVLHNVSGYLYFAW